MEENNTIIIEENTTIIEGGENPKNDKKLSTPQAIILAAFLIVLAIFITNSDGLKKPDNKTLSEKVGVSKEKLDACIDSTDTEKLGTDIMASVNNAMSALPDNQRGTPYTVVIGSNGSKSEIQGAQSYEQVKKVVDEVISGKVTNVYKGNAIVSEPTDFTKGKADAPITIIEYSDFECPYCKRFHPTMEQVVKDYNGQVKWIYRQFPLHQNSMAKLVAANCVGKIKGDEAYFQYSNLLFGLLKTGEESITEQL
jgi:protein-disulfide isomerase